MDTFQGINSDPVTLHKYTYSHNDSVNLMDPSGNSPLAESLAALSLFSSLALTTITVADFFNINAASGFSSNGVVETSRRAGVLALLTLSGTQSALYKTILKKDITKEKADAEMAGAQEAILQSSLADEENRIKRAVIGENQNGRVLPAAAELGAITINFTGRYNFKGRLNITQTTLSLAYNFAWIKTLRFQNFEIYDIGLDPYRTGPVSPWYMVELSAVRGYEKHIPYEWP